jgi:hypothetical protein
VPEREPQEGEECVNSQEKLKDGIEAEKNAE